MLSRIGDLKSILWLAISDGDAFFVGYVNRRCLNVVRGQPTLQWRCSFDGRQCDLCGATWRTRQTEIK